MSLKNFLFSCQGFIGDLKLLRGRESEFQNMNQFSGIGIVFLEFLVSPEAGVRLRRKNPIGNFGRRPAKECYFT